jgi:hypothetical protein
VKRGSPLKRKSRLRSRRRYAAYNDEVMRGLWHVKVLALAPRVNGQRVCPVCDRPVPLQGHHIVSKEWLKRHIRSAGLDADSAARLLWDARNGLPACERCHSRHTTAVERFPASLLTEANREFAREVGAEDLLDRYYPCA